MKQSQSRVVIKTLTGSCLLWKWKGPLAKEGRQPLEARKDKETDSPLKLPEEMQSDTLILVQ